MKNHRFKNNTRSKPEEEMLEMLREIFPNYIIYSNYPYSKFSHTDNDKLLADFYIQGLNIVIEYDGESHFKPIVYVRTDEGILKAQEDFKMIKLRDRMKDKLVSPIRIPYNEWKGAREDKLAYLKNKIFN